MKTQVLTCLVKKVKETVTSKEFERVEDVVLEVALLSQDPKIKAAAVTTRLVLDAKHRKQKDSIL